MDNLFVFVNENCIEIFKVVLLYNGYFQGRSLFEGDMIDGFLFLIYCLYLQLVYWENILFIRVLVNLINVWYFYFNKLKEKS